MKLSKLPGILAVLSIFLSAALPAGCLVRQRPPVPPSPPYVSDEGGFSEDAYDEVFSLLDILDGLKLAEAGEERLEELAAREDALGYEAALLLAARRDARGREAAPWYRRALSLYDSPGIRSALARHLEQQGQRDEAISEYLLLLPDEGALLALEALEVSPRVIAETLVKGGHWQATRRYLQAALEAGTAEPVAGLYARALAGLGQYRQAVTWFELARNEGELNSEFTWWYARSLEGAGREKEAKSIYRSLGPAGSYRLGLLLEKQGQKLKAAEAFAGSSEAASRWRGARLYEDLGYVEAALPVYLALAGEPGPYRDDAAYRVYTLLEGRGEQAEAVLPVLTAQPAWAVRLGREPLFAVAADSPVETPDFLLRVEALQAAGRADLVAVELAIGTAAMETGAMLALGGWYLEKAEYHQAVRWGTRALQQEPTLRAYRLAYLLPFAGEVQAAAAEFGLDPYLVWAVMREESRFRPAAVSGAGALGLMQVMPATGRDIAGRLQVSIRDSDLLEPGLNIRFGAFYLKAMLDMFGGDLDRALAAYNGGPGNAQKWSRTPLGAGQAGFPTAIAFFETREYITRVRNSYHTYRWLYSD